MMNWTRMTVCRRCRPLLKKIGVAIGSMFMGALCAVLGRVLGAW